MGNAGPYGHRLPRDSEYKSDRLRREHVWRGRRYAATAFATAFTQGGSHRRRFFRRCCTAAAFVQQVGERARHRYSPMHVLRSLEQRRRLHKRNRCGES
jgi:hypothetical protein